MPLGNLGIKPVLQYQVNEKDQKSTENKLEQSNTPNEKQQTLSTEKIFNIVEGMEQTPVSQCKEANDPKLNKSKPYDKVQNLSVLVSSK